MNRKQFLSKAFIMALATVTAGFGLTSCEDLFGEWDRPAPTNIDLPPSTPSGPISLTATVSLAAITDAADGIEPQWLANQQIAVIYSAGGSEKVATATISSVSGNQCTLTAELAEGVTDGSDITLRYPASSLSGTAFNDAKLNSQDGSLASLATSGALWCEGTGTLSVSGQSASLSGVTLTSQMAVWKLTLLYEEDNSAMNATMLSIKDATGNTLAATGTVSATNVFYMALKPVTGSNIFFEAEAADGTRAQWEADQTLAANTYYAQTLNRMKPVATVDTPPTAVAANLTYNNAAQTLFDKTGVAVTGGTIKYLVKDDDDAPTSTDGFTDYTDGMFDRTNAGTYHLYYYVEADATHTSSTIQVIDKEIAKATNSFTAQPSITASWSYGSEPGTLAAGGTTAIPATITYKYSSSAEGTYGTYADVVNGQAGTWYMKGYAEETDNYTEAWSNAIPFTINQAEITVSGITASGKTFDGTTAATLVFTGVTLNGKVGSDNISITATGAFEDRNAADGKTVNITGLTLTGDDAANYVLATTQQTTTTANISKKTLTVKANNQTINWGNTSKFNSEDTSDMVLKNVSIADDVTVTGLVEGDALTAITLTASTRNVTTTGKITPSNAVTTFGADNYAITYTAPANSLVITMSIGDTNGGRHAYDGDANQNQNW